MGSPRLPLRRPSSRPPSGVIAEETREFASDIDEKTLQDLQARESERRSARVTARTAPETIARAGASVELSVDTKRLYFFDPASGTSIHDTRVADTHNVSASLTR